MRIVAVVLAGMLASVAHADTWLVATVGSYHTNRDKDYNERNFGLGVEHDIAPKWRALGGFYENSYYRTSIYAGASYMPWSAGPADVGASLIVATGYRHVVKVAPMPMLSIESKRVGVNIGIVPSLKRGVSVIGLQLKARF